MKVAGIILIVVGLMFIAGAANDCDGRCVEQANDIGTMLWVMAKGLLALVVGGLLVFSENRG